MKKTNLWVVIPTGERRTYLQDIIDNCGVPGDKIVIVQTKDLEPIDGVGNLYLTNKEINIYHWWNEGIKWAMERGATHVAVLNDDLKLVDNPLQKILEVMVAEDATIGHPLPASSDPCGYCFILNLEHGILPDEGYKWWYGDNDLYERARKVIGVKARVVHLHPNEVTSSSPELMALTRADKERYYSVRNK